MRILIIEDEHGLNDAICKAMEQDKNVTEARYDGVSGYDEALTGIYDVIILDIMLPKMSGYEVLENLRKNKIMTPILMLTAKSEVESKVKGLDLGADYYLTKPFTISELMACIRAITRRPVQIEEKKVHFGDLVMEPQKGGVYCSSSDQFVTMGNKEFNLLETLMKQKGAIISKELLLQKIWGFEHDAEYNNLEVYVSFVRKKLAFIQSNVGIKAVRGVGYMLEVKS
ncbi:MAG: response regulator transcription factor [Clostridiales bacterium]|nr:response regulator transcription factor [Clostridiales bacterium]